jgi:hypothetical protein
LSGKECTTYEIEFKKWVIMYVLKHLPNENTEYVQGLLDLGGIWVDLKFPEYSPHIFQGGYNNISPIEYYTADNYKMLLNKHKEWIKQETIKIQQQEIITRGRF